MEAIKKFFRDKRVRTFGWNMLGSALSVLAVYLADLDPQYNIVLVPAILAITKYINVNYCSGK